MSANAWSRTLAVGWKPARACSQVSRKSTSVVAFMDGFPRVILQPATEVHMRWLSLLVLFGGALLAVSNGLAEEKPAPVEGWTGIFPELTNYARTFEAPVVEKEKDKPV